MQAWKKWTASGILLLAGGGFAAAQQPQDPPSRVARLKYVGGAVSFEPATVDQWTAATLNYPLTTGDKLYTDAGGRADLRIGANSVRLNGGTNFQFLNLNDQIVQISINSGDLNVNVRQLYQGEVWEVDTPNGSVTLSQRGNYRISCDPNRNSAVVRVRSGLADVSSNQAGFQVYAQQTAYFDGQNQPDIRDASAPDQFDAFIDSRDRLDDAPPPQYVSSDVIGYEDLAGNGSWSSTSEYGPVWYPRVEAGWAPYHYGHWAWVEPWGWTWIDDASWGFAPFHYGRWAFVGDRWGWCPGPRSVGRAVYAPALVAFVGGGGFGVGLSFGGGGGGGAVGWFPLGPREPYYPSYHVSDTYVRNVNITNTNITNVNITNVNVNNIQNVRYANQNVPGAVVAVPQNSFASAQSVQRSAVRVQPGQMQRVQLAAAPSVVPQRASVLGRPATATAQVVRPPANVVSRAVVARTAPPPAPVSFAAKQQALAQNPGRPVAPSALQTLQRSNPAPVAQTQVRTIAAPQRVIPNPQGARPPAGGTPAAAAPAVRPGAVPAPQAVRPGTPAAAPSPQVARPGTQAPTPVPQVTRPGTPAPGVTPQVNRPAPTPVPQATRPAAPTPTPQATRPGSSPVAPTTRPVSPTPQSQTAPNRPYVSNPALANPATRPPQTTPPATPRPINPAAAPQNRPVPAPTPQQARPAQPAPQVARPVQPETRPAAPPVARPTPQEARPQPVTRPQAETPRPQARPAAEAPRPQAAPPRQAPPPKAESRPKEEEKH